MTGRFSRRRVVAYGLFGTVGFGFGLTGLTSALAQPLESPTDGPSPSDGAPHDDSPTPMGEAPTDGSQSTGDDPAGETAPDAHVVYGAAPISIAIPAIGLEAQVVPVGQDPDGAMAAPSDPDTVAWYELGSGMGVPGNVVLAGHINWGGQLRAFGLLDRLGPGDAILIVDADEKGYEYRVSTSTMVRAEGAPVDDIFGPTPNPTLTLITCGGEYVAATREYLDRLIVRADGD
ncbi:MAG: class F sortase [Chloroflexi bacterium]|nr:class F sortase [Chloroflexota bacterium]